MLVRKLLRDIKKNLLSAITIVIITSLGIILWAGFEGVTLNTQIIAENYYKTNNLPDVFVTGIDLSYKDVHEIELLGENTAEGRTVFDMTAKDLNDATLRIYAADNPVKMNTPFVYEGSSLYSDNPRNIMVGYDFYKANNLSIGDEIELLYNNKYYKYTVIAAVKSPENIYILKDASTLFPNHKEFGFAFLDQSAITDMIYEGEKNLYNQIVIKTGDIEGTKDYILDKMGQKVTSVVDRSGQMSSAMIDQQIKESNSITGVFPIIFFIIGALIAFTSIKRLVDKERTIIGTMKALGISNAKIVMHYSSFGLAYGIFASLIGIPLSIIIPKLLMQLYDLYFSFPPYTIIINYKTSLAASVISIFISFASGFLASKSTLKLSPSVCMRPKASKPGKKIFLENIAFIWERLSFMRKIIFRNMFRNKDRLIMSVFGISMSCALIFIASGMQTSVDYLMDTVFTKVNSYDMKVFYKPLAKDFEMNHTISESEIETGELIMEYGGKLKGSTNIEKSASITVVPDISKLLGIYDGRNPYEPLPLEGCIISEHLANEIGVGEGDIFTVKFTGRRKALDLKVNKVIVLNFGQGVYLSQSAWRKTGEEFIPSYGLVKLKPDADRESFHEKILDYKFVKDAVYQSVIMDEMNKNMEVSKTSVSYMILFAGLMAFIVLFNLGVMNYFEREREIATLKVVGFFNKEVKKMAFGENYVFTFAGMVFGIIFGNLGLDFLLKMSVTEYYAFTKHITVLTYIQSIIYIFAFAFLTNMFLGRYTKRTDMLSSLKSIE